MVSTATQSHPTDKIIIVEAGDVVSTATHPTTKIITVVAGEVVSTASHPTAKYLNVYKDPTTLNPTTKY